MPSWLPDFNSSLYRGLQVPCQQSAVAIQHWPIRTITNDITSILIGHLQIFKFCLLTNDLKTTVQRFSKFLQQRQPCEPIREQNSNPSAIWLDGTVLTLATGCCKNLEKRCIQYAKTPGMEPGNEVRYEVCYIPWEPPQICSSFPELGRHFRTFLYKSKSTAYYLP